MGCVLLLIMNHFVNQKYGSRVKKSFNNEGIWAQACKQHYLITCFYLFYIIRNTCAHSRSNFSGMHNEIVITSTRKKNLKKRAQVKNTVIIAIIIIIVLYDRNTSIETTPNSAQCAHDHTVLNSTSALSITFFIFFATCS